MSYGTDNLLLVTDYTEAIYTPPEATFTVTNIDGTTVPPVTTINGNSGSVVGPAITISGGTTGMTFAASGSSLSLSGTLVAVNGGTGLSTYAQGDTIYASAANTLSKLAKDTNSTRYLSNTGSSNNPAWAQVNLTNGVTGVLPEANGGTNASTFATARSNMNVPRVHVTAAAPAVTDDGAAGFPTGSLWVDTAADDAYISVDDSSGAAIWDKITP